MKAINHCQSAVKLDPNPSSSLPPYWLACAAPVSSYSVSPLKQLVAALLCLAAAGLIELSAINGKNAIHRHMCLMNCGVKIDSNFGSIFLKLGGKTTTVTKIDPGPATVHILLLPSPLLSTGKTPGVVEILEIPNTKPGL